VYKWVAAVSQILAAHDIAQKTGGYAGLMKAPHYGCYLAKRLDLVVALGVDFIGDEDFNRYVTPAGFSVRFSDLNSRHDCLFFGTDIFLILPGRLGTVHEKFDLLNRVKLKLLSGVQVFLIEVNGYYSLQKEFQTNSTGFDLGPRISPADYDLVKIIDMDKTTPEEFAALLLKSMAAR
jgi:predicted Rossmann-fold nucleotide-binding protein